MSASRIDSLRGLEFALLVAILTFLLVDRIWPPAGGDADLIPISTPSQEPADPPPVPERAGPDREALVSELRDLRAALERTEPRKPIEEIPVQGPRVRTGALIPASSTRSMPVPRTHPHLFGPLNRKAVAKVDHELNEHGSAAMLRAWRFATYAEILRAFGRPSSMEALEGTMQWSYEYEKETDEGLEQIDVTFSFFEGLVIELSG